MPGRMALDSIGLELEKYVFDTDTDTYAILARGRGRLVLSFRGSFSSKNMMTDLKMSQTILPEDIVPSRKKAVHVSFKFSVRLR